MRRTSCLMDTTATIQTCTFIDAAGVKEYEPEDIDVTYEISGIYCRAEKDVGIMLPYFEDITAVDVETGKEVILSNRQEEIAEELLLEAYAEDKYGDI